jgi:hypothetical protein
VSIESLAIALHHSRASGTAKLVLIGIANHDGDGGSWPAVSTLSKYAGVNPRNVQKALDRLEQLGEIRRIVGQGGDHSTADGRRPNLYRFLLTCPHDCDRTGQHRTARLRPLMGLDEVQGVSVATGVSHPTPGVGSDRGRGVGSDTLTIPLTINTPVLKTALDLRPRNEEALTRCPFRPSGLPHVYPKDGSEECAHCGIGRDQYWDGKEIRNLPIGASA